MIAEPVLSEPAERFVSALTQHERAEFYAALTALCLNPQPDGQTKVELPFPHHHGALGFAYGDYWLAYRLGNDGRVLISTVYWSPNHQKLFL